MDETMHAKYLTISKDWKRVTYQFTAKESSKYVGVLLYFQGKGTYWVDSVSVQQYKKVTASSIPDIQPTVTIAPGKNVCADCSAVCSSGCSASCSVGCSISCSASCDTGCNYSCNYTCQTSCLGSCDTTCMTGCDYSCSGGCDGSSTCMFGHCYSSY